MSKQILRLPDEDDDNAATQALQKMTAPREDKQGLLESREGTTSYRSLSSTSDASSRYTYTFRDASMAATMTTEELHQQLKKSAETLKLRSVQQIEKNMEPPSGRYRSRSHRSSGNEDELLRQRSCSAPPHQSPGGALSYTSPGRLNPIDELIRSDSVTPTSSIFRPSKSTRRSTHNSQRGPPKTVSQRMADDRLLSARHTFNSSLGKTPKLPPVAPSPDGKMVPEIPNPTQTVHAIDGRRSVPQKKVGANGMGSKIELDWIGGPDRSCNMYVAQPLPVGK